MNLRVKLALLFSGLVAIVLVVSSLLIYIFYADFRKDEFYLRLEQKSITTYKALLRGMNNEALQAIDREGLTESIDEKILFFDTTFKMIYSSIDDLPLQYDQNLLKEIKRKKTLRFDESGHEGLGLFLDIEGHKVIVIASAYDIYGVRKLENLRIILIVVSIVSLLLTGFLAYIYVEQVFKPIHELNLQIKRISETNLGERLTIKKQQDEIAELGKDFNHMLDRLEQAFKMQKSFIQHASHELRTPLASMIAQTEAALNKSYSVAQYHELLISLNEDHKGLSELTDALLLLSRYESMPELILQNNRIDEILNKTIEEVQTVHPNYKVTIDYLHIPENESELEIPSNDILLKIAFSNLIRNACKYSDDESVNILIDTGSDRVSVMFINNGETIKTEEQPNLFTPFFRGENAMQKKGFGIGLSIAQRIMRLHGANIQYEVKDGLNHFSIHFAKTATIPI